MQTRRSFFVGAGALLIASPAIVRASSLMPIKSYLTDSAACFAQIEYYYDLLRRDLEDNLLTLLRDSGPISYDNSGFVKVYESVETTITEFKVMLV